MSELHDEGSEAIGIVLAALTCAHGSRVLVDKTQGVTPYYVYLVVFELGCWRQNRTPRPRGELPKRLPHAFLELVGRGARHVKGSKHLASAGHLQPCIAQHRK